MITRLHQSKLIELLQRKDTDGRPLTHTVRYCKKSTGELVTYHNAAMTTFNAKGDTINFLLEGDKNVKKLRRCLILQIDEIKIYY